MPSPPWHLRPYSPPSEPDEEPGDGGGGEGGDGEIEGGVLAVAVGDAGGGEGRVLEAAPALAEGGDAGNAAEHGATAEGGGGGGETAGGEAVGDADGGEGGVLAVAATSNNGESGGETGGGEGGEVESVAEPDAPKNTSELLYAIAMDDYGVSHDRSWSTAYPKAIQAYNEKADIYHQVVQKRGQPLREGFWIVKVRIACIRSL